MNEQTDKQTNSQTNNRIDDVPACEDLRCSNFSCKDGVSTRYCLLYWSELKSLKFVQFYSNLLFTWKSILKFLDFWGNDKQIISLQVN